MEGLVFDLSVPAGGVKQVGGTKLDALKQQLAPPAIPPAEIAEVANLAIEGTMPLVADETGAGLTAEQLRIMDERAEIASMTDRMKRQEGAVAIPVRGGPQSELSKAQTEVVKASVGPATEKLFPSDQPIGEEAAKKLMEEIRGGQPKKGR
jgi:hypothetical protein